MCHIKNSGIKESGLFLDVTDQIGRSTRHAIVVHEHKIDICVSTMAECGRLSSRRGFGSRRCCRGLVAGPSRCLLRAGPHYHLPASNKVFIYLLPVSLLSYPLLPAPDLAPTAADTSTADWIRCISDGFPFEVPAHPSGDSLTLLPCEEQRTAEQQKQKVFSLQC